MQGCNNNHNYFYNNSKDIVYSAHEKQPNIIPQVLADLEKEEYAGPGEDANKPLLGSGGTKVLTFKAEKSGGTELVLRLRRSWEAETEFADSFSVKLKIVEPSKYFVAVRREC